MSKRLGLALFLLLAGLFLIVNRGAYKGYFSDDEIDNLSWTPYVPLSGFANALVTPRFFPDNFRPAGHFYYHVLEHYFGLDFPRYVLVLHLFHLLNAWLLWILARKLGASPFSAAIASTLFTFHMALFDALWKPMYIFDVLCGTLCLISIIFYIERKWILSFLAFWVAYKSKELAVMLPAVLACYELWLGKRRWRPLVAFFAASLSFGLQGILLNPNKNNDYTFRFTLAALARTSVFYAERVLLIPLAGFGLLLVPFLTRNRRAWFGLAMAGLFFFPLLFLPGRMFSAYCYVPFTGLAIAASAFHFSTIQARTGLALFLVLWLPWNYSNLRKRRRAKLAQDDEARAYVTTLGRFAAGAPAIDTFVFAGAPAGFQRWGVEGAIKYFYKRGGMEMRYVEDPEALAALTHDRVAMLTWDSGHKKLSIVSHVAGSPDAPYLQMDPTNPPWQLTAGWFPLEGSYRWMGPHAEARLSRPPGAHQFELRVNIGPDQLKTVGPQEVRVKLNGKPLEPRRFTQVAWQTARWDLPPAAPGDVMVEFDVTPGFHPGHEMRVLGLAVGGFGFVREGKP